MATWTPRRDRPLATWPPDGFLATLKPHRSLTDQPLDGSLATQKPHRSQAD